MQIVAILEIHIIIQQRIRSKDYIKDVHDTISPCTQYTPIDPFIKIIIFPLISKCAKKEEETMYICNYCQMITTFQSALSTFLQWMRAVCAWERNKLSGWKTARRDKLFRKRWKNKKMVGHLSQKPQRREEEMFFFCKRMASELKHVKTSANFGGTITQTIKHHSTMKRIHYMLISLRFAHWCCIFWKHIAYCSKH